MEIDLSKAIDQFCSKCKTKKIKYLGKIMGSPAVFYKPNCSCNKPVHVTKVGKSDSQLFNDLQTPFWKLMGQKPKPKDIVYEKYLKSKNMTYGDAVRQRNLNAMHASAYDKFKKTH